MRVLVLMGVCGCGKSTIGQALAVKLGCEFVEGDSFHPISNRQKIAGGTPLSDADRAPWLTALQVAIQSKTGQQFVVVACSALKQSYRDVLLLTGHPTTFILLQAKRAILEERLRTRTGHFLPPTLLDSQLAILEPPTDGVIVEVALPPADIVAKILLVVEQLARS